MCLDDSKTLLNLSYNNQHLRENLEQILKGDLLKKLQHQKPLASDGFPSLNTKLALTVKTHKRQIPVTVTRRRSFTAVIINWRQHQASQYDHILKMYRVTFAVVLNVWSLSIYLTQKTTVIETSYLSNDFMCDLFYIIQPLSQYQPVVQTIIRVKPSD